MECIATPPVTMEQLMAVLDETAEPVIQEHIVQCTYCAVRLAEEQRFEGTLKSSLKRWDCPPAQQLGEYHLGIVSSTQDRAIVRHLAECVLCTAELEELRVFLTADAVAQPQTPRVVTRSARPRLGELVARMLPGTPAVALRGASTGPLMAEAEGTTIILDLQSSNDQLVTITGQLVADDQDAWTGALVELRVGDQITTAEIDDLGSFSYRGVGVGNAELRITASSGRSVVLPEVELTA